jgi:hypothetical protein
VIRSRVLRWVLVAALAAFAAFSLSLGADDGPDARAVGVAMAALAALVAVGLLFPGRRRVLLRVAAGLVSLAYVAYFALQLGLLLRGQRQPFSLGQPSP